jgi:hypothetical protein
MELDRANVIQMSQQRKEAAAEFVVPHLDFVIVTARNEHGVRQMKVHASDRTLVLFKPINDRSNAVIPTELLIDRYIYDSPKEYPE